jgi:hypothetical protein
MKCLLQMVLLGLFLITVHHPLSAQDIDSSPGFWPFKTSKAVPQQEISDFPYWRDHENYEIVFQQLRRDISKTIEDLQIEQENEIGRHDQSQETDQQELMHGDDFRNLYPPLKSPSANIQNISNQMVNKQGVVTNKELKRVLAIIFYKTRYAFTHDKERFEYLVRNIRHVIRLESKGKIELTPFEQVVLNNLLLSMFINVTISKYAEDLVEKMAIKGGMKKPLLMSNIHLENDSPLLRIKAINQAIESIPHYFEGVESAPYKVKTSFFEKSAKSLRGALSFVEFDPLLEGGPYSIKYLAKRKNHQENLLCLRMSTTTIGSSTNTVVTPEFQYYLKLLQAEGKKHTYINFQNGQPAKGLRLLGIENELNRVQCLQNFHDSFEDDTSPLNLITLSKNSKFYWQKNTPSKMEKAFFIAEFEKQLFDDEDSGFFFPKKWRQPQSEERKAIVQILQQVGNSLFAGKSILSTKDRLNFIEYAYTLISHFASKDSYSSNKTCKDGIDRAGAANAFDYIFLLLLSTQNKDVPVDHFQKMVQLIPSILLSDALMIRHREIKKERMERFLNVCRDLIEKIGQNPHLLQDLQTLTPFNGLDINYDPSQKIKDISLVD